MFSQAKCAGNKMRGYDSTSVKPLYAYCIQSLTSFHRLKMKVSRRYASNKNARQHASFSSFVARLTATTTSLLLDEHGRTKKKRRKKRRSPAMFDQRLQWEAFLAKHAGRPDLKRHLRMSQDSFGRLLSFVCDKLEVDNRMGSLRGGAILPELCLYACLRYLGGGSYSCTSTPGAPVHMTYSMPYAVSRMPYVVCHTVLEHNECRPRQGRLKGKRVKRKALPLPYPLGNALPLPFKECITFTFTLIKGKMPLKR